MRRSSRFAPRAPRTGGGCGRSRLRALCAAVSTLLLSACEAPQNYLNGAGPAAKSIAALGWFVLLVFCAVTVIVWLLIWWIAVRRRGTFEWHAPVDAEDGQRWIYVGGIAIPVAVLSIIFITTLQSMGDFPMAHAAHALAATPTRVIGRQWWFDAEYVLDDAHTRFHSPTELHVPAGRPVDIALETRDVIHSFWVPKLHGKVDLVPGQVNYLRIQADQPGRYLGECGEFCGVQHAHMRVEVVAHAPADYERWLMHQAAPAAPPVSPQALAGQEVFLGAACPLCHTVRGTPAKGTIGPDLTHLASRKRIAGGMLLNNRANLQAWVTNAQSLKPGSRMPSLTEFTGEELNALVTYLQGLH